MWLSKRIVKNETQLPQVENTGFRIILNAQVIRKMGTQFVGILDRIRNILVGDSNINVYGDCERVWIGLNLRKRKARTVIVSDLIENVIDWKSETLE